MLLWGTAVTSFKHCMLRDGQGVVWPCVHLCFEACLLPAFLSLADVHAGLTGHSSPTPSSTPNYL